MSVSTKLKINGSVIARPSAAGISLTSLDPVVRGDTPIFTFATRGRGYVSLPDPYIAKPVDLLMDFGDGLGDILVFRGDINGYDPTWTKQGYIHNYHATGIRDRGERIQVTDDNTGAGYLTFNADPGPDYRASRSGRNIGQMILETLSQQATVASLTAAQIGNFVGVGSGASAHCVMNGSRQVSSIVVDFPGTGYDATNRVTVLLLGGGGTGATAGLYTVSAGGIATIPVASGGSGYLSPPTVVFSQLPPITVSDLFRTGLDMVPPYPVTIGGDKLFSAIEGVLEDRNPNFWMDVQPDGFIRFHDQRKFGNTTVSLGGSPTKPAIIVPVVYNGKIETLWIANGGSGYGTLPSITFSDPDGSGASYSLSLTGGVVTGFTKTSGGSGYSGGRAKFTIDDAPLWVDGFAVGRDVRNCYQRVQCIGATYNEPICLKLSDGTLIEFFAYGVLSNSAAKLYWKLNDYVNPFEDGSSALASSGITGGVVTSLSISNPGFGYTIGSHPAVTFSPQPGSGANLQVNVNTGTGTVTSVTVITGGVGYDGPTPTLVLLGGGGSGATCTVTTSGGAITAVTVTNAGTGYTFAPTPILTGVGAGSGATATSDVTGLGSDGNIAALHITAGGTGYTRPPLVNIAGHGGSSSRSKGTALCLTTTTIRITSSDSLVSWVANYWDQTDGGVHGTLFLSYIGAGNVTVYKTAKVVSHTALTAGGTCDLTIDSSNPLDSLLYTSYDLVGDATPASRVYRQYLPADPKIRTLLQDEFSFPISVGNSDGTMQVRKKYRFAKIIHTKPGANKPEDQEWPFALDKDTGLILFDEPVLMAYGTTANLTTGGTAVDGVPDDIQVWLPRRVAAFNATYPADIVVSGVVTPQYAGTSNTVEGLTRTKQIYFPNYKDPSQSAAMLKVATEYHGSMSDAVVEGPLATDSAGRPFFLPGLALDFAQIDGTTCGLETVKAPVVSTQLKWGGGPDDVTTHTMSAKVSTRRGHYSGADVLPPGQHANEFNGGDGLILDGSGGTGKGLYDAGGGMNGGNGSPLGGQGSAMMGQFGSSAASSMDAFGGAATGATGAFNQSADAAMGGMTATQQGGGGVGDGEVDTGGLGDPGYRSNRVERKGMSRQDSAAQSEKALGQAKAFGSDWRDAGKPDDK